METVIIDLGTLGTGTLSFAYGVTSGGDAVVGQSTTIGGAQGRAFVWRNGTMTQLTGLDPVRPSASRGISADGTTIIGHTNFSGTLRAWRLRDNVYTSLGGLGNPGGYSIAYDTNSDGSVVVGDSILVDDVTFRGFYWKDGGMVDIGTLSSPYEYSAVNGVDPTGTYVVGFADNGSGTAPIQAFVWSSSGGMTGLGFPFSSNKMSVATAISANQIVVGVATFSTTETGNAFSYQNGVFRNLGRLPGFSFSRATDISADGRVITGYSYNTSSGNVVGSVTTASAFRYANGVMTNIGDLGTQTADNMSNIRRAGIDDPTLSSLAFSVSADGMNLVGTSQIRRITGVIEQHAFLYSIRRIRLAYYDDNQKFTAQARDDQKKFMDASSYTQFLKARASGNMYRYQG